MEDSGRGQGWRLMEQRLPSVSSRQSDLLITHCSGAFISLIMQIGRRDTLTHLQRRATSDIMGRLVFPLPVMWSCVTRGLCE